MPSRTLTARVMKAIAERVASATSTIAIARATRANQTSISMPIGEHPAQFEWAVLPY
jgi:hypothetical protein